MGTIQRTPSALLFQGIMVSDNDLLEQVILKLGTEYGPVLLQWGPLEFSDLTRYYEKEMGDRLRKFYLIFKEPVSLDAAWKHKIFSQNLETEHLRDGKRQVNIDPGLLTLYNFTLFSTKGFSHRIYLSEGIYSELTMLRKGGRWEFLPWTYPDYMDSRVLDLLEEGRTSLHSLSGG